MGPKPKVIRKRSTYAYPLILSYFYNSAAKGLPRWLKSMENGMLRLPCLRHDGLSAALTAEPKKLAGHCHFYPALDQSTIDRQLCALFYRDIHARKILSSYRSFYTDS